MPHCLHEVWRLYNILERSLGASFQRQSKGMSRLPGPQVRLRAKCGDSVCPRLGLIAWSHFLMTVIMKLKVPGPF